MYENEHPQYGLDLSKDYKNTYQRSKDYTHNGTCSRCGNCCTHHLLITPTEQQKIKDYIKKHHIKPIHHGDKTPGSGNSQLLRPIKVGACNYPVV